MSLGEDFDTKKFENELIKSGYEDIINSPFLQRLKGVSFLATMDHIYSVKQPFSRYDHSLGVAYLSLKLAKHLNLEKDQTEVLVITSLLHDIGHAPFSHAAETFLLEKKENTMRDLYPPISVSTRAYCQKALVCLRYYRTDQKKLSDQRRL